MAVGTIVLAVAAFVVSFIVDALAFGSRQPVSVMAALAVSTVFLLIGQVYHQHQELNKVLEHSRSTYEAVKDRLDVIRVGTPHQALDYISGRIPSLVEVRNTVLNYEDELVTADERLYDSESFDQLKALIGEWSNKRLRWKDIGDATSVERFRRLHQSATQQRGRGDKRRYQYKLLKHSEPQMNFIVLNYGADDAEVLFNWDYRSLGQDPLVLLSRDREIVNMLTVHFEVMWKVASPDHDNTATRSTS